ncbi:hypothetical protein ACI2OX_11080 [Bacillus sp. N9]
MLKQVEVDVKNKQLEKTVTLLERFLLHGDLERADKAKKLIKKYTIMNLSPPFADIFQQGNQR